MTSTITTTRGSEFSELRRIVQSARLLERGALRYLPRMVLTFGSLVVLWYLAYEVGNSWFSLLVAAALAVAFTQIAFLGHDSGHQQVTCSRAGNTAVGLITGNLLTGLSIGWWVDKHNRHHANPNKEDHDPDIGEGVLAFTATAAEHRNGPISRWITRHQAALFFPLLLLEGLQLHVASIQFLMKSGSGSTRKLRRTEIALMSVHMVGYVGGVLLIMSPLHALAFVAVHQAVFGLYMGCSFAPNHKGMPIIAADEKVDFLRRQVLTSRNVRGNWLVDQLLGGLNYQIEHHLFPSMPRANLRRVRRIVRGYCEQHDISYTETGLFGSYAAALRYLHSLGEPLRTAHAQGTPHAQSAVATD